MFRALVRAGADPLAVDDAGLGPVACAHRNLRGALGRQALEEWQARQDAERLAHDMEVDTAPVAALPRHLRL
jgi:hypothetical protein